MRALHPSFNETVIIKRDKSVIKKHRYSFDQQQFNQFQQFLKTTDSKTVLQYHWEPQKMRENFSKYYQNQRQLSLVNESKEMDVDNINDDNNNDEEEQYEEFEEKEEEKESDEKQKFVAMHDANNYEIEKEEKQPRIKLKKQYTLTRESERMEKYDKQSNECCGCILL